jgi:hypothetical protein
MPTPPARYKRSTAPTSRVADLAGAGLPGSTRESRWMGRLMDEPQLSSARLSVENLLLKRLAILRRSQDFLEQLHAEGVAELHIRPYAREDSRLELSEQSPGLPGGLGLAVALDVHPRPGPGRLRTGDVTRRSNRPVNCGHVIGPWGMRVGYKLFPSTRESSADA